LVIDWKLPYQFVEIIARHQILSEGMWDSKMLDAVCLGCRMADALGFAAVSSFRFSYQDLLERLPKQKAESLPCQG